MKLWKMTAWGFVGIIAVLLITTPCWEYAVCMAAWIYLALDNR